MAPQFASRTIPNLCSLGPRPLVLTGAIIWWLRGHFAQVNSIEDPDLVKTGNEFLWRADDTSAIVIESVTKFDPKIIENRPALFVKRQAWQTQRMGIGDRMLGHIPSDGSRAYGKFLLGSHTVFCLAGEPAECEKLAAEVYREVNEFAPAMRDVLALHRLELTEVGELALLEESREHFVVPVSMSYAFMESWVVKPWASVFSSFDLAVFS